LHITAKLYAIRLVTIVALLFSSVTIYSDVTINILTEDMPPISYYDESDSTVKGFGTEVIRLVMEHTKLDYKIQVLPWARALSNARDNPNTIIYTIARTADREDDFIWLQYLASIDYHFYGLKKNKHTLESKGTNIHQLNVAINRGDAGYEFLKSSDFTKITSINSNEQLLNLLHRQRVDLIVSHNLIVYEITKSHAEYKDNIVKLNIPFAPPIGFYFAINSKTQKDVIDKIKSGFSQLVNSGELNKLMKPVYDATTSANKEMSNN